RLADEVRPETESGAAVRGQTAASHRGARLRDHTGGKTGAGHTAGGAVGIHAVVPAGKAGVADEHRGGGHVCALPAVFHAGGETGSVARHATALSPLGANAGETGARESGGRLTRLRDGQRDADSGRGLLAALLGAGYGLSAAGRVHFRSTEPGAVLRDDSLRGTAAGCGDGEMEFTAELRDRGGDDVR